MSLAPALYQVSLSADPPSAAAAGNFVRLHLLAHGLDGLVEDIRLVASELATNAVRHARSAFTVSLDVGSVLVVLSVGDSSPTLPSMPGADPELISGGGRGLAIVELLSSDWGVAVAQDGSKTVWASFDSDGETRAAP